MCYTLQVTLETVAFASLSCCALVLKNTNHGDDAASVAVVYRGQRWGKQIYTMHSTIVYTHTHTHQINRKQKSQLDLWIEDAC